METTESRSYLAAATEGLIGPESPVLLSVSEPSSGEEIMSETPDLTFGSFSVLYDPQSTDSESNALLRVEFRNEKSESGVMHLYGLIQRKQAVELNKIEEDARRIEMLTGHFRVRLVGKKSSCKNAETLVSQIKSASR